MNEATWTVQVYENGKWLGRLTPEGTTTRKVIFAAMIKDRLKAEQVASEITDNPELVGVSARVEKF